MLPKPQRDSNGVVIPYDCREIADSHGIIRKISDYFITRDPQTNKPIRISSMAFKPSNGINEGMSVDLEQLMIEAQIEPIKFVTTPRWIGSVKFKAQFLRSLNFIIGYDPIEAEGLIPANPFHGEVWGRFTRSQIKQLQQNAEWYVPIKDVLLR